ncbi:MAG: type IV pilus modification PilV family protein [Candidatus Acidiferrales bacterium]
MSAFNKKQSRGFSLIEVMLAVGILAVGLMAVAALITRTLKDTAQSREMSLAALLASEKLEDLNRWPATDPHVTVGPGLTAGSLAADTTANVVVGGVATTIAYFDDIVEGQTPGFFSETVSGIDPVSGGVIYTTTTHAPDGTVTTSVSGAAPAGSSFKRRWTIEGDQPVPGVRRITVFVTNQNPAGPVTFQMSTVRP